MLPVIDAVSAVSRREDIEARFEVEGLHGADWRLVNFALQSQVCLLVADNLVVVAHQSADEYKRLALGEALLEKLLGLPGRDLVAHFADEPPVWLNALKQHLDSALLFPDLQRVLHRLLIPLVHLGHHHRLGVIPLLQLLQVLHQHRAVAVVRQFASYRLDTC